MLSDETFPIELDEHEQYSPRTNTDTLASTETEPEILETSGSTSGFSSENTCNTSTAKSLESASFSHNESHYISFESTNKKLTLPPPKAPIKKKKSYSCHDLIHSKKNYDHVESKVRIDASLGLRRV